MLNLNLDGVKNRDEWESKGISLPNFDIKKMREHTNNSPVWVHFGAGNIFRGYIARLQQDLLDAGLTNCGIIVAELYDTEIIEKIYVPHDNLALLVTLNPDGRTEKKVIASIASAISILPGEPLTAAIESIFANPSLQMASVTITEKGYTVSDMKSNILPSIAADMNTSPGNASSTMGRIASLMLTRYHSGAYPIALLSLDNCSHNGQKLRNALLTIAKAWHKNGFADKRFITYLEDEESVSFPWSMIDKITPRPSDNIASMLREMGLSGISQLKTQKNTFIAPFVNAEVSEYLVIEDRFPNGRPLLEKVGVYFTDSETVNKVERMKVTACLNPLHTALSIFGCLLGYTSIASEMKDPDLLKLVECIGYNEGLPVVVHPGILDPEDFLREVLTMRLPNPHIPDTPQRIATDTSQKIPIRFGQTIKAYMTDANHSTVELTAIPLSIAGWFRYLLGFDDSIEPMELSSDPMLETMHGLLRGIGAGNPASYTDQLRPILCKEELFGVNLNDAGLGDKIEEMFKRMLAGKGAVRAALKQYLYS